MRRMPGEGTIHLRPNGTWCGQIDLGIGGDGKRRRKTVYGKSQEAVRVKLRDLNRQRADNGDLPTSDMTLGRWLDYWLTSIAAKRVKPNTYRGYRTEVERHIKPSIGNVRLGRLSAAHVRRMHDAITATLSSTTAHNAHRVLSAALNDAHREGRVGRNVAALIPAPAKAASDREGLSAASAITLLNRTTDSRWMIALLLGVRQGERLGLRWSYLDLDAGVADLSWALTRVPWSHGCDGTCERKARSCPQRRVVIPAGMKSVRLSGNLVLMAPKSRSSQRIVPLPAAVVEVFRRQLAATETARPGYTTDFDLVWANADGTPLDPRADWAAWKDELAAVGIPHLTLHEARHTTATLLLELGVDTKVISAILGHSDMVVTQSYQHVNTALARAALDALSQRLQLES